MRVMLEKVEPWHVRTGVDIGYPQQIALISSLVDPWSWLNLWSWTSFTKTWEMHCCSCGQRIGGCVSCNLRLRCQSQCDSIYWRKGPRWWQLWSHIGYQRPLLGNRCTITGSCWCIWTWYILFWLGWMDWLFTCTNFIKLNLLLQYIRSSTTMVFHRLCMISHLGGHAAKRTLSGSS